MCVAPWTQECQSVAGCAGLAHHSQVRATGHDQCLPEFGLSARILAEFGLHVRFMFGSGWRENRMKWPTRIRVKVRVNSGKITRNQHEMVTRTSQNSEPELARTPRTRTSQKLGLTSIYIRVCLPAAIYTIFICNQGVQRAI